MVNGSARGGGLDLHQQYRNLQVIQHHISQQEMFLQMLDHEESFPDMARRLGKEAILGELHSNKRLFLDYLYNLITLSSDPGRFIDVEFHYISIGKGPIEVDKCLLWFDGAELPMPFEIGDRFGKGIVGDDSIDAPQKILSFYKEAEVNFDRDFSANLDRCSLVILQEIYPVSSFHIRMRLPAIILNDYPITI